MKNENANIFDDDRIGRLLLKLTIPSFLGMSVITLYNVTNTIFIGQFVGSLGIAGLSIVFPIQMLSMGMGMMTGMGGASLISRSIGAGDRKRAERALGNAISGTLVLSLIIMVAGLSDMDFWLRLMGSSEDIVPYARDYMQIILLGMFFQTLAMSFNSFLIAEGNARIAMTGQIIGAVTNIILDATFIIALHMGVKGAALGTIIAQFLSVMYFVNFYFRGHSRLKIRSKNLIFSWEIIKPILGIGASSLAMTLANSISSIFINRMLVSLGSDTAISAYGILNRISMFAMMPGISIGQGLQPILGFNYGVKRYDRAIKAIKIAIISATILCFWAFFVTYFVPEMLVRIFSSESNLITTSVYASKYLFITLYLLGFINVSTVMFQALGKATKAFVISIAKPLFFLLPLVLLLSTFLKLDGVWLAYPLADVLTFLLVLFLVIPQLKELRKMDVHKVNLVI